MLDTFIQWFLLIAIIIDASIAWFVLLQNPKKPINQAYWLMMTAVTLWQLSNFLLSYFPFKHETGTNIALHAAYPFGGLVVYCIWYFCGVFPRGQHHVKQLLSILGAWLIGGVIIIKTNWLVELTYRSEIGKHGFEYHWLYGIFVGAIVIGVVLIGRLLYKKYQQADLQRERIRFQYLITGLSISISLAFLTNIVIQVIEKIILHRSIETGPILTNIGPAASVIFSTLVAYAILRHRLLDIKIILQRKWFSYICSSIISLIAIAISFGYGGTRSGITVTLVMAIIFIPLQRLLASLIRSLIKKEVLDLFKLTALEHRLLATCHRPDAFFRKLVSQIMQRIPLQTIDGIVYDPIARYYHTSFRIGQFSQLQKELNRDEPWLAALRRVSEVFDPSGEQPDPERSPEEHKILTAFCKERGIQFLVPLTGRDELLGVVLIGDRIDGEGLSLDDKTFLTSVPNGIGSMIYNILQLYHCVTTRIDDSGRIEEILRDKQQRAEAEQAST